MESQTNNDPDKHGDRVIDLDFAALPSCLRRWAPPVPLRHRVAGPCLLSRAGAPSRPRRSHIRYCVSKSPLTHLAGLHVCSLISAATASADLRRTASPRYLYNYEPASRPLLLWPAPRQLRFIGAATSLVRRAAALTLFHFG